MEFENYICGMSCLAMCEWSVRWLKKFHRWQVLSDVKRFSIRQSCLNLSELYTVFSTAAHFSPNTDLLNMNYRSAFNLSENQYPKWALLVWPNPACSNPFSRKFQMKIIWLQQKNGELIAERMTLLT